MYALRILYTGGMRLGRPITVAALAATLVLVMAACGGGDGDRGSGGTIAADGSSTVGPFTTKAAEDFRAEGGADVIVGISGTGGGFERFCRGETDISNASRPIKVEEAAICAGERIEYLELTVATDALTNVVNPENDWVDCLTVDQLRTIWAPGSLAHACEVLDAWPGIAVLTAHVLVGEARRDDPACAMMDASPLPSHGLPGKAVLGFLAGACVFRRERFLESGGYEPRFLIGGEEALLAIDIVARGHVIVYTRALTVHHQPSTRRNVRERQRHTVRNALWVAWLRRPLWSALARSADIVKRAGFTDAALCGFVDAARELPWVLRERRVIPPSVEALCALLEKRAPLRPS